MPTELIKLPAELLLRRELMYMGVFTAQEKGRGDYEISQNDLFLRNTL